MIGLEAFRPDLVKHDAIVSVIEPAVRQFTVRELETMNAHNRQAGIPAYRHEDFLKTPHVCLPISQYFPTRASCEKLISSH